MRIPNAYTAVLPKAPNKTGRARVKQMHDDYNATAITQTNLTAENFRLEGWTKVEKKKKIGTENRVGHSLSYTKIPACGQKKKKKRCCTAMSTLCV